MRPSVYSNPALIRQISSADTYSVRSIVLRPGRPPEECHFEGDDLPSTFHYGAYMNEELVAVASYMKNRNALFNASQQYQLRGMAVLPEFQKRRLGELLLMRGEQMIRNEHAGAVLWFNARETAVDFYTKFGYTPTGEPFMIPNVCRHVVMFKAL